MKIFIFPFLFINNKQNRLKINQSIILLVNCKDGANSIAVGSSFNVKIPKKEADIIFIVEEDVQNEKIFKDMIAPLMTELREELKQQGITCVLYYKFHF